MLNVFASVQRNINKKVFCLFNRIFMLSLWDEYFMSSWTIPWIAARISQHETIIFGGNGNEEGADAWSHPKSWLQEKNERSNERMLSLFFLLWYYSPLHSYPPSFYNRWSSFSIAAIFVYGTSRRRKRGRSDDAEEASARGGCGRESEDVRPWGG